MTDAPFFRHVRRAPSGAVASVARESWTVEAERCRMAVEAALPDASVELYFNLGPRGRHVSAIPLGAPPPRAAWVVGPRDRPLYVAKETRDCHIVGVRLHPWMTETVLGVRALELRNAMIDLDAFWSHDVEELRDRLAAAATPADRLSIVERAVVARARNRDASHMRLAATLCDAAERDVHASVGELAVRFGLTHRRVIELFDQTVGLKPKTFHRVRRLRRVFTMVQDAPRPTWTTIAHRCGYFDQAHLINDFRSLTGVSPREYESTRSSVGLGFIPHVLARQLDRP